MLNDRNGKHNLYSLNIVNFNNTQIAHLHSLCTLGFDHIEVYGVRFRYTVAIYAIRLALRHRRDSAPSSLHHLMVES